MSESHCCGFHRPVQKLVDSLISVCRLPQGKRKCMQIPPSAPKKGCYFNKNGSLLFLLAKDEKGLKYSVFRLFHTFYHKKNLESEISRLRIPAFVGVSISSVLRNLRLHLRFYYAAISDAVFLEISICAVTL